MLSINYKRPTVYLRLSLQCKHNLSACSNLGGRPHRHKNSRMPMLCSHLRQSRDWYCRAWCCSRGHRRRTRGGWLDDCYLSYSHTSSMCWVITKCQWVLNDKSGYQAGENSDWHTLKYKLLTWTPVLPRSSPQASLTVKTYGPLWTMIVSHITSLTVPSPLFVLR